MRAALRSALTVTLVSILALPAASQAANVYVGPAGEAEYQTIQAAVEAALNGDVVVIRPGTYTGSGNRDVDLLSKAITIQSTNPLDPNIVAATVVDCRGTRMQPHRAFFLGYCRGVTISGLTLTNGLDSSGGAIYCTNSTLDLTYCRIVDNGTLVGEPGEESDAGSGGALYVESSTVVVRNCLISGNLAGAGGVPLVPEALPAGNGGDGGGLFIGNSTVQVIDCDISDNAAGAGGDGGALRSGNGGSGGAIYCVGDSSLDVRRSRIERNAAGSGGVPSGAGGNGGGIYSVHAAISHCVIAGNRAGDGAPGSVSLPDGDGGDGGGLHCVGGTLSNTLIAGNRTGDGGGLFSRGRGGDGAGIFCGDGAMSVTNCTIVDNVTGDDVAPGPTAVSGRGAGAGVFLLGGLTVRNTILWNNHPDTLSGQDCEGVTYSDIEEQSCADGEGSISAEPQFRLPGSWVDADDASVSVAPEQPGAVWVRGDYQLQAGSPCIDAGDPGYAPDANETDLTGSSRIDGAAIDMGAYESHGLMAIYRFWSPTTRRYFYTGDEAEKDFLVANYPDVWTLQGLAYYAFATLGEPNLAPVYRFWSNPLGTHFYTISEAEGDWLIAEYSDVWTLETEAFYAYPEGQQPADASPVYRFWSESIGGHFYTASESEKDALMKESPKVWTYEGIAWYAYAGSGSDVDLPSPPPPTLPPPPTSPQDSNPVAYEFTGGPEEFYYVLQLKAFLDGREAKMDDAEVVLTPAGGWATMVVDLGSLSTTLDECHLETSLIEHMANVGADGSGSTAVAIGLSIQGFFESSTLRGAFNIDPQSLSFPVTTGQQWAADEETFSLVGSVTVDGRKLDVQFEGDATAFGTEGRGTLDTTWLPDRLDLRAMPFTWSRQGREDLLLDTEVKGHAFQLYVASIHLQTGGLWHGQQRQSASADGKK